MATKEQSKYESTEKRNARETVSEREARRQAEAAAAALGGMSGKAAEALSTRKSRLDKAIEEAGG